MHHPKLSPALPISFLLLLAGCNKIHSQKVDAQVVGCPGKISLQTALQTAQTATELTQSAKSSQDWSLVSQQWVEAIKVMQSVSPANPQYIFAQKKAQEYISYLQTAQSQGNQFPYPLPFDSFASNFLNQQLLLYLSYVEVMGVPDILIVGSSRAVQGIEPQALQSALVSQGKPPLKIFNLGINGATAQVVDLLLREILTPEQLPKIVIWGDGVRAFNDGKLDRTYQAIATSGGYQQLLAGNFPTLPVADDSSNICEELESPFYKGTEVSFTKSGGTKGNTISPGQSINAYGFLPVAERFNPTTYYQEYPRVAGLYDGDYQPFNLGGKQAEALERAITHMQNNNTKLVFVSLPLSQDYLDITRQKYEQEFRNFITTKAAKESLLFMDMSEEFLQKNNFFADPSHLNKYGAVAVSEILGRNNRLLVEVGERENFEGTRELQ